MNIYNGEPENWKDLQDKVANILLKCGYKTETPKTIQTIRGNVEVDVYAYKNTSIPILIICECKYWNSRVPLNIVHGFRTVISDIGANIGVIIARNGFQAGSYMVSNCTNITLCTWDDFMSRFKDEWLSSVISNLELMRYQLYKLSDPYKREYGKSFYMLDSDKKTLILKRMDYYFNVSLSCPQVLVSDIGNINSINNDLVESRIENAKKVFGINFESYNSYFSFINLAIKEGIEYFKYMNKI